MVCIALAMVRNGNGNGDGLQVTDYGLRVTGYGLRVTKHTNTIEYYIVRYMEAEKKEEDAAAMVAKR
ncbi:hypothetical protein BPAE_0138g00270 [Botrytis paeoniae]|uniref:Uncharacterized protein n=1 Tax=Botrytis paeoniae TaxID=278948 RepID=A0A4Z1FEH0_9HELO|nr:hypothetical protein BPAE_0138g00270 [Botrytis paeoniae]